MERSERIWEMMKTLINSPQGRSDFQAGRKETSTQYAQRITEQAGALVDAFQHIAQKGYQ